MQYTDVCVEARLSPDQGPAANGVNPVTVGAVQHGIVRANRVCFRDSPPGGVSLTTSRDIPHARIVPALSAGLGNEAGVFELLTALPSQIQPHVTRQDSAFLQRLLREKNLRPLLKMHDRLKQFGLQSPAPILPCAGALARELGRDLQGKADGGEAKELGDLLADPHIKGLLSVHDTVAKKGYGPVLPPLPDDLDEEEDSVKIIQLVKSMEPLGATVKRDAETGAIVVARIMKGGAADRSGLIHEGDELKEVNGVLMEDKRPEDIIDIVAGSQGAVTFKVVPGLKEDTPALEKKLFVRALFDYDPLEDKAIPCKEAGLPFRRGDILQVVSWEEPAWWQARVHGDANPRAGLVPSKLLQERRLRLQRLTARVQLQNTSTHRSDGSDSNEHAEETAGANADYGAISGIHIAGLRRSFRLSRRDWRAGLCECGRGEHDDEADVLTYEEVVPYHRDTNAWHRLVLLVGPRGVGLHELKRRLLISDPEHFSVTVPHTTRVKRDQETDGEEYKFVSKLQFEADIAENKFIEHGEFRGNFYGTSLDTVRSVLQEGKVCLLDVPSHRIKRLRTAEFKPYVVFVKPPPMELLRQSRRHSKVIYSQDERGSAKLFTEEDFEEMGRSAQVMENQYGHLFEKVIINDDLAAAFRELSMALKKLEKDTNWIPKTWATQ